MTEDILFDNIYVGHSLADAKALAVETFEIKKRLEVEADKAADPLDDDDVPSWKQDPVAFIRYKALVFLELAQVDPVLALKTHPETSAAFAGAVFTLFGMIGALFGLIGAQQKPITKVRLLNFYFRMSPFLKFPSISHPKRQMLPHQTTRRQRKRHLSLLLVARRRTPAVSRSGNKGDIIMR